MGQLRCDRGDLRFVVDKGGATVSMYRRLDTGPGHRVLYQLLDHDLTVDSAAGGVHDQDTLDEAVDAWLTSGEPDGLTLRPAGAQAPPAR